MKYIFCILTLLASSASLARGFHAFAGYGITFVPSTFRLGYEDWEGGMINQSIGFDKIFDFGNSYYSSFGIILDSKIGFYGGMGLKTRLWILPIRCELAATVKTNGDSFASGLVGVTYGF